MKTMITLAALITFSAAAVASEGNSLLDDINVALTSSGHSSGTSYSYNEGTSILDDSASIAMIESMSAPLSVGDIDMIFREDSALGSLFHDE